MKLFEEQELKLEDFTKNYRIQQDTGFHIMRFFQSWKEGKNFVLFTYCKRVWKLAFWFRKGSTYAQIFSLIWKFVTSFFEWPSTWPEIDIIANQASEISTDFKSFLCGFSEGFMNVKTREVCTAELSEGLPPQTLADDLLTLFHAGADYAHHISTSCPPPLRFRSSLRLWSVDREGGFGTFWPRAMYVVI